MVPPQIGLPGIVEFLIVGLLWLIIPVGLAYWVYTDGKKRSEEHAEWWALAAGG